jgi:hypothetical protein
MHADGRERLRSRAVQQLMDELAQEDGQQFTVNHVLYERSAAYQRALDVTLAAAGCWVQRVGPMQYQIRPYRDDGH